MRRINYFVVDAEMHQPSYILQFYFSSKGELVGCETPDYVITEWLSYKEPKLQKLRANCILIIVKPEGWEAVLELEPYH